MTILIVGSPPLADIDNQADLQAGKLMKHFMSQWDKVKTLQYHLVKEERLVDRNVRVEEVLVKVRKPNDFFMGAIKPKAGQEVVYSGKRNPNQLTAHRGSFPDITVTISIYGWLATKNQHHTVLATGFKFLIDRIIEGVDKAQKDPRGERIIYKGELTFMKRKADKIVLNLGNRPHRKIEATKSQTLFDFSSKVKCDPYLIVYYNPDLLDGLSDSVNEGETYVVPDSYGKKVEIILDREYGLPLRTTVWDFEGKVYERYTQKDMRLNLPFTDKDFDPKNPDYNF